MSNARRSRPASSRRVVRLGGVAVIAALLASLFGVVASSSAVDAIECIGGAGRAVGNRTKQQAFNYSATAAREGFHNGSYWDHAQPWNNVGVCWDNDNDGGGPGNPPDRYDSNRWPVWNGHDRKEGSDCSGLVAKGWGLRPRYWEHGRWSFYPTRNTYRPGRQAGRDFVSVIPYSTRLNASWYWKRYRRRAFMDIAATNGHVLFVVAQANDGRTRTLESRGHWRVVAPDVKEAGFYTRFIDPNEFRIRARRHWAR